MFLRFRKTTKIAELEEGSVAVIEGKVVSDKEIALPGGGAKCVYYEMSSESYRTGARGRGRPMWLPDKFEAKCSGFFVDDGTGRAWVGKDVDGFTVTSSRNEMGQIGKRRRYSAYLIKNGDVVRVRGSTSRKVKRAPADVMAIVPSAKGVLEILLRKKSA
jgi:hypothetical protein